MVSLCKADIRYQDLYKILLRLEIFKRFEDKLKERMISKKNQVNNQMTCRLDSGSRSSNMKKNNTHRIAKTQYFLPHKPDSRSESLVLTKMAISMESVKSDKLSARQWFIQKIEMGRACSQNGGRQECFQNFNR